MLSLRQLLSTTVQTATMGLNASITPGISNEARANYSNQKTLSRFALDNFGGAAPLPDSLLFPAGASSGNSIFEFYLPGAGAYNQGKSVATEQRQVNLVDNLSVTSGRHQMKFVVKPPSKITTITGRPTHKGPVPWLAEILVMGSPN